MLSHNLRFCTRPSLAAAAVALALALLIPTDGSAQEKSRRVILADLSIAEQMEIASLAEATSDEADKLLRQARTRSPTARTGAGVSGSCLPRLRQPKADHGGRSPMRVQSLRAVPDDRRPFTGPAPGFSSIAPFEAGRQRITPRPSGVPNPTTFTGGQRHA